MASGTRSDLEMSSSSSNSSRSASLLTSDPRSNIEHNFPSPNPSLTSMAADSRRDNERGSSSSNPSLNPIATGGIQDSESGSSSPNPSPTPPNYALSIYSSDTETEYRSPHPPTGTGYTPSPSYYRSFHPDHQINYGGSYPGQPSYYPPPPPYDNPVYDDPSGKKKSRGICICRIIVILVIVTIICSTLSFFLDLIFRPKYPFVSITSASVSSFSTDDSSCTITSDFSVTFSVYNPNKHMGISYRPIDTRVSYGLDNIARRWQVGFSQDARAETSKVVRIIEVDAPVDSSTVKGIDDDITNGGLVEFNVEMHARMKFSQIIWFKKPLVVYCPDVRIQLVTGTTTGGMMVGPPVICHVSE